MSSSYSNTRGKSASPLGAGLNDDARKAMNSAFDALSAWRNETSAATEKNSAIVFERMAAAAKTMGWPTDFVDMTRQQMQTASRMQLQVMDQIMDVWEQQMKAPGSPVTLSKGNPFAFPAFAGMGGAQSMPGFPAFDLANMPTNPMQFWMQAAEMWQKSWQQAMTSWIDMQQQAFDRTRGGGR